MRRCRITCSTIRCARADGADHCLGGVRCAGGTLPVYLAHSLGGGADIALEREIARDLRRLGAAVVIRVGGVSRFVVRCTCPAGVSTAGRPALPFCRSLLAAVPRLRIVYSCGVGDPGGLRIARPPPAVRRDVLRDRLEARLHDFFPVSPAYCLLAPTGAIAVRSMVRARIRAPLQGRRGPHHRAGLLAASLARLPVGLRRDHGLFPRQRALFGAAYPDLSHQRSVRDARPDAAFPNGSPRIAAQRPWVCWATSTRRKARA
jgi:hypothetical protein